MMPGEETSLKIRECLEGGSDIVLQIWRILGLEVCGTELLRGVSGGKAAAFPYAGHTSGCARMARSRWCRFCRHTTRGRHGGSRNMGCGHAGRWTVRAADGKTHSQKSFLCH